MRNLDNIAIGKYGIDILQMMELAGFNLAQLIHEKFYIGEPLSVLVAAGSGNNGGGGLVAARHLYNFGHRIYLYVTNEKNLKPAPTHQLKTIHQMEIKKLDNLDTLPVIDVVIDALIGYGQTGKVRDDIAQVINFLNGLKKTVVALDNPSGLNVDNGIAQGATIKASITLTLAALKRGLVIDDVQKYVGGIYLADIGIPKEAYKDIGIGYPFELETS